MASSYEKILGVEQSPTPTPPEFKEEPVKSAAPTPTPTLPKFKAEPVKPAAPTFAPTPPELPEEAKQRAYDFLLEQLDKDQKAKEAREAKRYRRQQIINAIGEGVTALSNLYFTTQYAPNMYNAKDNSLDRTRVRYLKDLDDSRAEAKERYNRAYNRFKEQSRQDEAERDWRLQLAMYNIKKRMNEAEQKRKDDEARRERELHRYQVRQAMGKADEAEAKGSRADEVQQSIIDKNNAAAGASKARASASYAQAKATAEKSGSGNRRYYGTFEDKDYESQADYDAAVLRAVKKWNREHPDERITTETVTRETRQETEGRRTKSSNTERTKRRDISDIRSELEAKRQAEAEKNGYRRGGGKKPATPNGRNGKLPLN